jgi:hypothetical protein
MRERMEPESTTQAEPPHELCGYAVVEVLAANATFLAIGPGGRGITLKKLDPDCLHNGLLHPDVRDRLSRIRELAHPGVANLIGVGKEGDAAWLIWEYAEGKPFAQYAAEHCRSSRDLAILVRELVLTVDSLHTQGIVHGSLQSGNIIVAPDGSIRLTHVSPLLYTEPSDDAEAIEETAELVFKSLEEQADPVRRVLNDYGGTSLRTLATKLAVLADGSEADNVSAGTVAHAERRTRRRAVVGALMVTLAGGAAAYGVWHSAGRPGSERLPAWLK